MLAGMTAKKNSSQTDTQANQDEISMIKTLKHKVFYYEKTVENLEKERANL